MAMQQMAAEAAALKAKHDRAAARRARGSLILEAHDLLGGNRSVAVCSLIRLACTVRLTQGYWMSDHEVTQAEYQAVMGSNPSQFKGDLNRPVEEVSWDDAVAYCKKLTERERAAVRITAQQEYRLPTESEWEYAARAGTTGARHGESSAIGWHEGNHGSGTNPVKQKAPNAWGLHDMMGNVYEWCSDIYGKYPTGSVTNPTGPGSGSDRVYRGGCWYTEPWRSAKRNGNLPSIQGDGLGFRTALSEVR